MLQVLSAGSAPQHWQEQIDILETVSAVENLLYDLGIYDFCVSWKIIILVT